MWSGLNTDVTGARMMDVDPDLSALYVGMGGAKVDGSTLVEKCGCVEDPVLCRWHVKNLNAEVRMTGVPWAQYDLAYAMYLKAVAIDTHGVKLWKTLQVDRVKVLNVWGDGKSSSTIETIALGEISGVEASTK